MIHSVLAKIIELIKSLQNIFFAAGDAPFFYREQLNALTWVPQTWLASHGLGTQSIFRLWYDYVFQLLVKCLSSFGFSWWWIDKILWFGVVAVSWWSAGKFVETFKFSKLQKILAQIIYTTNTYSLLIWGGGQFGVAVGYALSPWVLGSLMVALQNVGSGKVGKRSWTRIGIAAVGLALVYSLLVAFDLRLAYIILIAAGLYAVFIFIQSIDEGWLRTAVLIVSLLTLTLLLVAILESYWILPTISLGGGVADVGNEITGPGILTFLSFADFSHAMGLLHTNWPENLFGFIHFLQPEFLGITVLAFVSLWRRDKTVGPTRGFFFMAFLSLLGIFLAKGINEPFGKTYEFLFTHVPGFVMLRDPTKWYLLVALGYSMLLPQGLLVLASVLREKIFWARRNTSALVTGIFLLYWLFLLRPVIFGKMTGNFSPPTLPDTYSALKDYLRNDAEFGRVLWMPEADRFTYGDDTHPIVDSFSLFGQKPNKDLVTIVASPEFDQTLKTNGIRYVAVATDEARRIYFEDHLFTPQLKQLLIDAMDQKHFTKVVGLTYVSVYKAPDALPLFSFTGDAIPLPYKQINATHYSVEANLGVQSTRLVFLMKYNPKWQVKTSDGSTFPALKRSDGFMEFAIDRNAGSRLDVQFTPQKLAETGALVSSITFVVLIGIYAFCKRFL